ncbi:MAG: LOG family protein [Rhodospirillaceae bacterium]|jgi:uncharacterized protein (TIGR00730 family)|nr:LOG family protein [Rhodospirillales bacterium]MBT3906218.1 LOG family protein [Rhodospirillaceae bacterium]MBT4700048.1 LOG family protein [Rhodospirillaceae bacterium]MBT5034706.1 LOG family protein [Rhodospirillaceae bacterium]MBT6221493.1 LOG family protein [Rhodospirillaceae bacterium]
MPDSKDDGQFDGPLKAFRNSEFMDDRVARPLRILSEYLEPEARFDRLGIIDTVVFFGSARIHSREEAEKDLKNAEANGGDVDSAKKALNMSRYYEDARELARRMTEWSKHLEGTNRRFVVCTGGGPGIMEAANRGASEAKGLNIGLNINLPQEQHDNPYISRELAFEFHYFFMRKFWFMFMAKALVIFPGGFGTMDELFETMTLITTHKIKKKMPIVLFGTSYWNDVLNIDAMVEHGTVSADEAALIFRTDSVDEAFAYISKDLEENALADPEDSLSRGTRAEP